MHIIRHYLLREIKGPFFLSLLVSTMILAAGHIIQVADLIINKGVSAIYIFNLFLMLMPWLLTFTIPISILSATLLSFGRLASDNEIIALKASGVSLYKIAAPAIVVSLIVSLFCVPLNDKILPESGYKARKLIKEIGIRNPLALLEPGVFIKGFKNYVIFVYSIKGNKMKNIRIYQPQDGGSTRTIVAEKGEVIVNPEAGTVRLKLQNGSADEALPHDPDNFYKLIFETYYMTLDLKEALKFEEIDKKPREMNIAEIKAEISKLEKENINATPLYIEMHNKLALAFSNFVFVLIGIPIAIRTHRREKSINFGLTMLLFLIYWAIMLGGVACAIRQIVPPWVGIWMANAVLAFTGVILFFKFARK